MQMFQFLLKFYVLIRCIVDSTRVTTACQLMVGGIFLLNLATKPPSRGGPVGAGQCEQTH